MAVLDWLQSILAGGGDPDQQRWAETQAQQPGVLQHLQNVLSDVPARFGGTNSYDPNRSLAQNTLDPESLQQAMTIGTQVSPGAIRAYHGSPHNFDAFDMSKIGTGEGAQAYGHGLYFAENEAVARGYRDALAKDMYYTPGGEMFDPQSQLQHLNVRVAARNNGANLDATIARAQELMSRASEQTRPMLENDIQTLRAFKGAGGISKNPGSMYEVNLHADPEAFLNWDKRLVEQSPDVQRALAEHGIARPVTIEALARTGSDIYDRVAGRMASDRLGRSGFDYPGATGRLQDAGIPGIRYLDQGSRAAGEGSHNYAVFDPKIIEIMRKYGIVPPLAGAGLLADQQ